ncbi:hypothetical protein LCGC14_2670070, partial [marine sediment metagenome]
PTCFWRLAMEASAEPEEKPEPEPESKPKKRRAFVRNLVALLQQPIEDGVYHPAEAEIRAWLDADRSACCDWLSRAMAGQHVTPSFSVAMLRIVGRLSFELVGQWGLRVAGEGLQNKDVEVREAAVRALEA